jgi:hypothetical protein
LPKGVEWLRANFFPNHVHRKSTTEGSGTRVYEFRRTNSAKLDGIDLIYIHVTHGTPDCVHVAGFKPFTETIDCIQRVNRAEQVKPTAVEHFINRNIGEDSFQSVAEYVQRTYLRFLDNVEPFSDESGLGGSPFRLKLNGTNLEVRVSVIPQSLGGFRLFISGPEAILANLPRKEELQRKIEFELDSNGSILFTGQKQDLFEFGFRKKEAEALFGQSRIEAARPRTPPVSADKTFKPPKPQKPKEGKHKSKTHGAMRR